ncbi:MAG: AMP-binding protein [Hydrogenophilales bacterium]|nr:AMP-binding protein [Hydrogenophilales bacterium]
MGQDSVLCVFGCGGWTGVGYRWAASPWLVGGTTVIQQSHNPHRVFSDHNLTHAVLIPSALATILAAPKNAFACNDKLHLFVGGGAMTRAQVGEIKSRITPNLYNWLASTEAGCIAVTPIETPDDHRWHKLVADRIVEIVDDDNNPVPNGTMGRIRIGAEGGPNGYLNDETTSREFFQNGYFYPGDMAAMRHDGRVSLYGRITDVINMGGRKCCHSRLKTDCVTNWA